MQLRASIEPIEMFLNDGGKIFNEGNLTLAKALCGVKNHQKECIELYMRV